MTDSERGALAASEEVMDERKMKAVYSIIERAGGKSYWMRIGVGFVNRDGSMTLKLDALPTNASLHVRDMEMRDDRRAHETSMPAAGGIGRAQAAPLSVAAS